MTNKRYANIKEVSDYTSLPIKSLYELAGTGRIPSIKIGCKVLFGLQDLDKVMASLKHTYLEHEKTANKIIGDLHGNGI